MSTITEYLDKHYERAFNTDVDEQELEAFKNEFIEINRLKALYKTGECNRKEVSEAIKQRVTELRGLLKVFELNIIGDKKTYEYDDSISDYTIALGSILRMANKDEEKYGVRKLTVKQLGIPDIRRSERETSLMKNEVCFIADKQILHSLDYTDRLEPTVFQRGITDLINAGNSVVVVTNHDHNWYVLPKGYDIEEATKQRYKTSGSISDICAYTYDDELGKAMMRFSRYIEEYGGDLSDLTIDDVTSRTNALFEPRVYKKGER